MAKLTAKNVKFTRSVGTTTPPPTFIPYNNAALLYTLDNPNYHTGTLQQDQFGYSVSVSGNYAIIGARYETQPAAQNSASGAAYIYDVTTGQLKFTIPNPVSPSAAQFGECVSISGNYAIVGAPRENVSIGLGGRVYIYKTTTGDWTDTTLLHTINNPNAYSTTNGDQFGLVVSIDGNYAIAGSYEEDGPSGTRTGAIYVIDVLTGNVLYNKTNISAYNTAAGDRFATVGAISGDHFIIGAPQEDDAGGNGSGAAYIFDVSTGNLLHTLTNPNAFSTSNADLFGTSVAISGNYAVVGAESEEDALGTYNGKAYIYDVITGTLLHTLDNPNAYSTTTSDYFGRQVAVHGNHAIIGAEERNTVDGGNASGTAYLFDVTTGNLLATIENPNAFSTSSSDQFAGTEDGTTVSIYGDYVVIGAPEEDETGVIRDGKAYIFQLSTI